MNRIKLGPLAKLSSPPQSSAPPVTQTLVPQHAASDLDYSLFIPMHYERKYSYPLIVWLHSNADDERQILRVMPQISTRNYAAISVRAPDPDPLQGYRWLQSLDSIDAAQDRVERAIDCARCRLNIADSLIFVGGLASGGTMAFRIAFRRPQWFAGVASVNGRVPCNETPLSNLAGCRKLPVFWSHSRWSETFPESELCRHLRLLHVAGFSVTLRQYPCGDQVQPQTFSDLNVWLMNRIQQVRGKRCIVE